MNAKKDEKPRCRKCGVELSRREIVRGCVAVYGGAPVLDLTLLCAVCRADRLEAG